MNDILKMSTIVVDMMKGVINMLTLREWRRAKEITQAKLAEAIGVHVNTYLLWEKEPTKIPIGYAFKIANIIGVPIENIDFLSEKSTNHEDLQHRMVV